MNDIRRVTTLSCALFICAILVGCSETDTPSGTSDGAAQGTDAESSDAYAAPPTYHGEAKAIIDARCGTCHKAGDIGPFPLTTYDEVTAFAGVVRASIVNGTMPPWQPADDCNTFADNIDLTPDEKDVLLAWLDGGMPEGEAANKENIV